MKRIAIFIVVMLSGVTSLCAQPYVVHGTIENAIEGVVNLASFYGDRFQDVDSMETVSGSFYFMLSEDAHPGLYRITYPFRLEGSVPERRFIEFIFNREDIEVFVASGDQGPHPYFENTLENQVYSEFMAFELNYEAQLMIAYGQLNPVLNGKEASRLAVKQYDALQHERNHYMDSLTMAYPDLYAIRIMNAFRAPVIPGALSHRERIDTLKECFFNHAAIDDPGLLFAPVYTFKLVDFLSLFKMDTLSPDEQDEQFMEAVDQVMANVSGDPELRSFVVEFLLQGFESLDMEMVQVHLADHYLDEACESDIVELVLARMEGYKTMTTGKEAPDFVIRDMHGRNHQLSRLDHPYVLVMFWSSTCEHCHELLPELHQWYLSENQVDLEVVAISIDTSMANFEIFTDALKPAWITSHEPLGWNGKVPSDYFVYATPSLFLLDRERHILARPGSFRQFLRAVKKLGI